MRRGNYAWNISHMLRYNISYALKSMLLRFCKPCFITLVLIFYSQIIFVACSKQLHAFLLAILLQATPGWNWQKNQAKAKQQPEAELLLFENYSLFPFTLSSKNNMTYSKSKQKNKCVCIHEIIRLIVMKMKMKMKNRSHRYDINRLKSRHGTI